MSDPEIKLQCLEMAIKSTDPGCSISPPIGDVLENAKLLYEWVTKNEK